MTELVNIIFWIVYAVGMLAGIGLGITTVVYAVWGIAWIIKNRRAEDGK